MVTATWELHLEAPGFPKDREKLLSDLHLKKLLFTEVRLDYIEDGDRISMMFADLDVLVSLLSLAEDHNCKRRLSCSFTAATLAGPASGILSLDQDGEEHYEIDCPSRQ